MPVQISRVDFDNWLLNPVTQEVREMFRETLDRIHDVALSNESIRDQINLGVLLGRKEASVEFLELTFETLVGIEEPEKE